MFKFLKASASNKTKTLYTFLHIKTCTKPAISRLLGYIFKIINLGWAIKFHRFFISLISLGKSLKVESY